MKTNYNQIHEATLVDFVNARVLITAHMSCVPHLLGGSFIPGLVYIVNTHGDRVRPLRIGLWDPFQMAMKMGDDPFTTYVDPSWWMFLQVGGCGCTMLQTTDTQCMVSLPRAMRKRAPGCLGYRGWNTTRLCGEYFISHEIRIPDPY